MKSSPFVLYLLDLMAPLGPVAYRRMFGGGGLFLDGRMFAIVDDETLYLKADDITRAAFEAARMEPFLYESKTRAIRLPYHRLPDEFLDDADDLLKWARMAIDAAGRAPLPRARKNARQEPVAKAKARTNAKSKQRPAAKQPSRSRSTP